MAVPDRAYTGERVRLGWGEQLLSSPIGTPVAGTTWIGKLRPGTLSGFGAKNIHDHKYFSGDGRLPSERVLHGVDIGPISFTYELQNGIFLVPLFGSVSDEGVDDDTGGSTLNTASVVGATTVDLVSEAGYAISDVIAIDEGVLTGECRTITALAPITFVQPLRRVHAAGVTCNEVIAPFTHTLFTGNTFPFPFTLQGVWDPGETNEVAKAMAGCHIQEAQLAQDLDGEVTCTPTVIGSKPNNVVAPASLPTALTTPSYLFSQLAATYSSLPAVDGVQSWTANIRNGGSMRRWAQATDAEFAAEYIPDQAHFAHELVKILRRDDSWDAMLARTDPVTGDLLYTRGGSDTFKLDMTAMVIKQADSDAPEGGVEESVSFEPGEIRLVFVDTI
ncbi:MAG: hypothetical protein V3U45_03880, partial [bacterium]